MRAKMSDRTARQNAGVEYINNSTVDIPAFPVVNTVKAALAEDEARAILAETEPTTGYSCVYVQFEPTAALAEALSAFVEG